MSNLISSPEMGSKSNPLLPKSFNDINNIPVIRNRIYYKYTCECGRTFIKGKRSKMTPYTMTHCNSCSSKYTNRQKYGEDYYKKRAIKTKETLVQKFGTLEAAYDAQEKTREEHNLKEIGCKNYFQSENIKKRIREKNIEKYNAPYGFCKGTSLQEKLEKENIMKYGSPSPFSSKDIQEKATATKIKKYNDPNFNNREKAKSTCISKYGVEHPSQSEDFRIKLRSRYFFNDTYFDSSWELAYYIYLKDHNIPFIYHPEGISYNIGESSHKYFPDFRVENKLIEIKGDHMIRNGHLIDPKTQMVLKEKEKCMLDHNVIILKYKDLRPILDYIYVTYGRKYLKAFKLE